MRRTLVGGVGLYMAGGDHLWGLKGFVWGAAGAFSLGDSGYFQLSSFILIWGLTRLFSPLGLEM